MMSLVPAGRAARPPGLHGTVLALALGLGLAGSPATQAAAVITYWHDVATNASAVALPSERPSAGLDWAMVHGAMYDAVNAIDGGHEPLFVSPAVPTAGASKEAAAVAAAHGVLRALFPSQAGVLDAALQTTLAGLPADGRDAGVAVGADVAARLLASRAGDGRYASVPYAFGSGPGVYQPTPPAFGAPVLPWVARVRTFVLTDAEQVRPDGPAELGSDAYAADYLEVKTMGAAVDSGRTPAQTEIARFHTENPTRFWGRNIGQLVDGMALPIAEHSRLMAMLFVSYGDANIACWNAKYHYDAWRPVTAIWAGDSDGNDATAGQPGWMPLAVTPPHPEYPAAHGCAAGAVMEALREFTGTRRIAMTFTSTVTGQSHSFTHTQQFLDEIADARVYGGMHFRSSVEDGLALGKRVAKWVAKTKFQAR
jgi:hypothetical protein